MSSIRQFEIPSKYLINHELAGDDKFWSTKTTYDDLLMAHGQHVKDYADIGQVAKGLTFSKFGQTLSSLSSPLFEYFQTLGGGVETVDKNWLRWRVFGDPDRRALSFGNPNAVQDLGAGGFPFKILLDVDWYKVGDVLSPHRNKRCRVLIVKDSVSVSGGHEYEVVLVDEDQAATMPEEYLQSGEYWLKVGTMQSWEKGGTFGSIQFGSQFAYVEFQVPLNTSGWMMEVDGEAHRQYGSIEVGRCYDEDTPEEMPEGSKITNFLEMKAGMQIEHEKELTMAWGEKTEHLLDPNTTEQITSAPGLFAYLEEGNIIPYSPNSSAINFMVDQLDAFWFDRVPENQRRILLYGGTAFIRLFSKWVEKEFGNTAATYQWDFVLQRRTAFDSTNGRDGYAFIKPQFTEYHLPTFGVITVAHWPLLDNTRINGALYPNSHYPVSSYEAIAFNIGFGEPDLRFFQRVDNKISTYVPGLWSPVGATGQDNPVFKTPAYFEDSYKWIHRESYGIVLMDPTNVLWFRPNVSV